MKLFEKLVRWKGWTVAVLFFLGLTWTIFSYIPTPFHMDAEASELWAAFNRKDACQDAKRLDQEILEYEIRLATENLTAQAKQLIDNLLQKKKNEREQIRQEYGC